MGDMITVSTEEATGGALDSRASQGVMQDAR
jgi:hypothetical protein